MLTYRLVTTLAAILVTAPTICGLHRQGAIPVPMEVIQEARALQARYRHLATHRKTFYDQIVRETKDEKQSNKRQRQRKQRIRQGHRGLADEHPYEVQVIEQHLFQPHAVHADNEATKEATGGDATINLATLRQVGLEGSAQPLFFCSSCSAKTQKEQDDCARCKGSLLSQQEHIKKAVQQLFPEAKIVASTIKLVNMVFVEMAIYPHDDIAEMDHALRQIPGVLKIVPQEDSTLGDANVTAYMGGGAALEERFCGVGGKGVRIAILDSGVDYTHERLGGPGTVEAYQLAYGTGPDSRENKEVNPNLFPNDIVIGGKDFLGESFVHTAESLESDAFPDDNPIDANRHGTMVADAILSVAPQVKLLACKVCTSDTGTCPGFAVLQALEYIMDPNDDDNTDDRVDIVNLSLGGSYLSSYYDLRTEALEKVFQLGVMPVVAAGNEGNVPFIGGPGSKTPNALAVAATSKWQVDVYSVVASYSSRGPGDQNNLKPDISAPSGLRLAQYGTGSDFYENIEGTSFAAPLAAGALALIKERCPGCSPFALKAILMNNAKRHIQYHTADLSFSMESGAGNAENATQQFDDAPNSLVGAGEMQLQKALDSDIWAYCADDIQPSISWGLINAHKEIVLKKTIKVINLLGEEQSLQIRNEFSNKLDSEGQENPMTLSFSPEKQILAAGCNTEVSFEVTLTIDASKAPANHMTSGGKASNDPTTMDWNEFGGWIIIENLETAKDISLAYHALIRQASDLKIEGNGVINNFNGGPTKINVNLTNHGAGVAQVDAFELLYTSEDDPEGAYGHEFSPSDFKYIGYRVIQPKDVADCDYLLEFSFTTWEKQKRLNLEFFQVHLDIDLDTEVDYILFNSGVFTPFTDNIGCIVRDKRTGDVKCTGFPPDHGTNTGNTILRVCSNDIGFPSAPTQQQQINVYILTATATHLGVTEVTDRASENFHTLEFPRAWVSAPSYNIYPGARLETLEIDGTGGNGNAKPLGLVLITNSYRGSNSTGCATAESEAMILAIGDLSLPAEVTSDELDFPVAKVFDGPECVTWEDLGACQVARSGELQLDPRKHDISSDRIYHMYREGESDVVLADEREGENNDVRTVAFDAVMFSNRANRQEEPSSCPETTVPRSEVLLVLSPNLSESFDSSPLNDLATNTPSALTDYALPNTTEVVSTTSQPSAPLTAPPSSLPPILRPETPIAIQTPSVTPTRGTLAPSPIQTMAAVNNALPPATHNDVTLPSSVFPILSKSTTRPTGPLTAAIVMYPSPAQRARDAPANIFYISGASRSSLVISLVLGGWLLLWILT